MAAPTTALKAQPTSQESYGSPAQATGRFTVQSFFDSTALQNGILPQPTNSQIVESTETVEQTRGYGVALHPSSETPVMVQFHGAGVAGSSGPIFVTPGQVVRPQGRKPDQAIPFAGFTWGLPFGWLGGGLASLLVLRSPDAEVHFGSFSSEVLFHRVRLPVIADQAVAGFPAALPNFPLRFPWTSARRTVAGQSVYQKGQPIAAISEVTRIVMRLRPTAPLAVPASMRIVWQSADTFDLGGGTDPATLSTETSYRDVTWPANTGLSTASFPVLTLTGPEVLLGGDNAIVRFLDLAGAGGPLAGAFVDVLRFGKL